MKYLERRKFIGTVIGVFGLFSLSRARSKASVLKPIESDQSGIGISLKGKQDSKVKHWDIITIGNLSRNKYWGESDDKAIRNAICTCTLISGEDFHVIVDPSLADKVTMETELKRRTGLALDDIDLVFITHQHGDHISGLKHFPKARWLAGAAVATGLNNSRQFTKKIEEAGSSLFETIDIISTPGHTPDHQSLRFDYKGLSIVIAGDAVATSDFWDDRQSYYNVMDVEESERSMEKINLVADIIVPGHDNLFLNF
jgi:hypothetical protein